MFGSIGSPWQILWLAIPCQVHKDRGDGLLSPAFNKVQKAQVKHENEISFALRGRLMAIPVGHKSFVR